MQKELIKDTLVYGGVDFLGKFINFIIFPILAYHFSVAEFGVYTLLTVLSWFVVILMNCGINHALEQFYLNKKFSAKLQPRIFTTGLICLIAISLTLLLPGLWITYLFRDAIYQITTIKWDLLALALINAFPNAIFQYICSLFRLQIAPWLYTILNFIQAVLALVFGLYFIILCEFGVSGLLLGSILSFCLILPFAAVEVFRSFDSNSFFRFKWKFAKEMFAFGLPFFFTDLGRWIYGLLDRLMLDGLSNIIEVGLFGMAFKLATVMIFMMNAFALSWTPRALKAQKEEVNHRTLYSKCLTSWFALLTLVALAISLFGKECLILLTPSSYWPSASLLPAITMALVFLGTTQVTIVGFFITKNKYHLTLIAWIGALVNCLINLYLIPVFGAQGAAVATLITYAVLALYYLYFSQKLYPIPLEYKKLTVCLIILVTGGVISFIFNQQIWSYELTLLKIVVFLLIVGFHYLFLFQNSRFLEFVH